MEHIGFHLILTAILLLGIFDMSQR